MVGWHESHLSGLFRLHSDGPGLRSFAAASRLSLAGGHADEPAHLRGRFPVHDRFDDSGGGRATGNGDHDLFHQSEALVDEFQPGSPDPREEHGFQHILCADDH